MRLGRRNVISFMVLTPGYGFQSQRPHRTSPLCVDRPASCRPSRVRGPCKLPTPPRRASWRSWRTSGARRQRHRSVTWASMNGISTQPSIRRWKCCGRRSWSSCRMNPGNRIGLNFRHWIVALAQIPRGRTHWTPYDCHDGRIRKSGIGEGNHRYAQSCFGIPATSTKKLCTCISNTGLCSGYSAGSDRRDLFTTIFPARALRRPTMPFQG